MKAMVLTIWGRHHEKFIIMADQAIVSGSNFLIGILISKLLGLEDLGVYAFAWMVLMMCSSLQQNFISIPMVNKYVAFQEGQSSQYLNKLFIVQVGVSLLLSMILFLLILIPLQIKFFDTLDHLVYVLPFLIFSFLMQDFTRRIFILKGELFKLLLADLLVNWSQVVFLIIFVNRNELTLMHILVFFTISYSVGFSFAIPDYFKKRISFKGISDISSQHWVTAKWLLASAILQWFAGNYFIISAGTTLGTESAGIIRIAQSLVGVMNIFFIALEFYVPPKAAIIYQKNGKKALIHYITRITFFGTLLCLLFTGVLIFTSGSILTFLYGSNYEQYNTIIIAFSAFYIIVFLSYPLRFVLRAMNNMKDMFWAYLCATLFSMALSGYMVRKYEIWGVIAGLALTQLIMQIWYIQAIIFAKPKTIEQ